MLNRYILIVKSKYMCFAPFAIIAIPHDSYRTILRLISCKGKENGKKLKFQQNAKAILADDDI